MGEIDRSRLRSSRACLPFSNPNFSSLFLSSSPLLLLLLLLLLLPSVYGYQNYTVGDSLGWYDNLMDPKVNYQKWAAAKNFSLGDFLVFNTDKNHTVVQTYNVTTYSRCDYNDADNDDTVNWSAGEPEFSTEKVTVAVPLLKVGMTYFFSGNYDGEQCEHGQHLKIDVTYGQGLPDSLKSPSEAPAPANPEDGGSMPEDNFNNPKETETDDGEVKPTSDAGQTLSKLPGRIYFFFITLLLLLIVG